MYNPSAAEDDGEDDEVDGNSGEGSDEASGEKHDAGDDDHREAGPSAAPAPIADPSAAPAPMADPSAAPAPIVPAPGFFRGMYYKQGLGSVFRCESFLCAM